MLTWARGGERVDWGRGLCTSRRQTTTTKAQAWQNATSPLQVSDANKNVILSPLSLFSALSMAAMGATKDNDAEEQLRWLLR